MGNVRVVLTNGDQHYHEANSWNVDALGTLALSGVPGEAFQQVASYRAGVWQYVESVVVDEVTVAALVE